MITKWGDYARDWETNAQEVQYSKLAFGSLLKFVEIDVLHIIAFGCETGLLREQFQPRQRKL